MVLAVFLVVFLLLFVIARCKMASTFNNHIKIDFQALNDKSYVIRAVPVAG